MFKNIFLKTLYEKRWMVLFWTLGVVAMAMLMMAFYHSFSAGGFDEVLKNLPKSFQGLVGNVADLKTVAGYVSQEVFALRIPLLTLIMGVVLFTALLAGDENQGTLQTLLTQPVSRLRVFVEKYLAGVLVSFIICLGAFIGVALGLIMIHERMGFGHLFEAVVGVWLLTLVFGTLGFALGAITGKRGLTGSLTSLATFGTYLITSFAPNVAGLSKIEKFSPFHYYNNPGIAQHGLQLHNVLVMLVLILIPLIVSAVIFQRRDIYQR